MPDAVGGAEGLAEIPEELLLKAFARRPQRTLRPVLLFYRGKFLRREVERFLPAHDLPLPFATLARANHGVLDAGRIVKLLDSRVPARTQHPLGLRILRIGVQFFDDPLLDDGNQRAFVYTHVAGRRDFPAGEYVLRRSCLRL